MTTAGFATIPTVMLDDERVTRADCDVWIALSSYLGCDEVRPSHATIAKRANLNISTVKRSLNHLRELGLVEWQQRRREDGGQTSNVYRLITPWSDGTLDADLPDQGGQSSEPPGVAQDERPLAHHELPPSSPRATPSLTMSDEVDKSEVTKRNRGKRATELPLSWSPNDRHRAQASTLGISLQVEEVRFRNWAEANGRRFVSWDAAFRNWLDKSPDFRPNGQRKAQPSERHTGLWSE